MTTVVEEVAQRPSRNLRGRAGWLALLLLAACGTTPASPPPSAPAPTPTPARLTTAACADLVVLGLRGQGQSIRTDDGVGAEVDTSVRATVPRLPDGVTVRLEAVAYPNGPDATYDADVARGARLTERRLRSLAGDCPDSRFALVGYSQGAQVVHETALALPVPVARIAAVAVLGDPVRDPADPTTVVTYGTGALTGRGNAGRGAAYPTALRDRTLSFCVRGDDVCNAPLTGRVGPVSATHREFYESPAAVRVTAGRIARLVGARL